MKFQFISTKEIRLAPETVDEQLLLAEFIRNLKKSGGSNIEGRVDGGLRSDFSDDGVNHPAAKIDELFIGQATV